MSDISDRDNENSKTIYRFKLSPDIVDLVTNFSKLHMYSSRQIFRDKWKEWLDENKDSIDIERNRLRKLGYKKNIEDKMFTASRYYFKNKEKNKDTDSKSSSKDAIRDNKKREYIVLDENIISIMDSYIKENKSREFKPSSSYEIFKELNKEHIDSEVKRLKDMNIEKLNTRDKCIEKIKKTYKNRCYVICN